MYYSPCNLKQLLKSLLLKGFRAEICLTANNVTISLKEQIYKYCLVYGDLLCQSEITKQANDSFFTLHLLSCYIHHICLKFIHNNAHKFAHSKYILDLIKDCLWIHSIKPRLIAIIPFILIGQESSDRIN